MKKGIIIILIIAITAGLIALFMYYKGINNPIVEKILPENPISKNILSESRLLPVRLGNKCGFVDKTGKYVINPQFDDVDLLDAVILKLIIGK